MNIHKSHIENILHNTINALRTLYRAGQFEGTTFQSASEIGSRLVFPHKRRRKERVSEQELRFTFVEQFYRYLSSPDGADWNVYYSIETPTQNEYSLSSKGERSANVDLVLYDSTGKRIALIEFKALNPGEYEHMKDTFKLRNEPGGALRYFVEIVTSRDSGTFNNIESKLQKTNYRSKKFRVSEVNDQRVTYMLACLADTDAPVVKEI